VNQLLSVGVVGTGNISDAYLKISKQFSSFDVVAVADLDMARAEAKAAAYSVAAHSPADLLAHPDIDLILNLTVPDVHAAVSQQALSSGKHVYSEKPLATTREDGRALLEAAQAAGLRVGCAPDTFLGAGLQTCRELVDAGAIGTPIAATAFMMSSGPEHWHPNPAFFYAPGAGPLFDMGPYYLTALVHLLGPISSVAGSAVIGRETRPILSEPLKGQLIEVTTPTHVSALLEFAVGAVGTMIMSMDAPASELPRIEVYGTEATLSVPDPNTFGGPVRLRRAGDRAWEDVPLTRPYSENSRGLGLADMARGLVAGRPHRASGELAYHVLDAMQSILEAAEARRTLTLSSTCPRPAALGAGQDETALT
jgi:predicted dehydrogenase